MNCGVRIVECRMRSSEWGVRNGDCEWEVRNEECGIRIGE
jgi:hypothetical protein